MMNECTVAQFLFRHGLIIPLLLEVILVVEVEMVVVVIVGVVVCLWL